MRQGHRVLKKREGLLLEVGMESWHMTRTGLISGRNRSTIQCVTLLLLANDRTAETCVSPLFIFFQLFGIALFKVFE